jgi:hypothetical protein
MHTNTRGYSRPAPHHAASASAASATPRNADRVSPQVKTERLPFTIRRVRDDGDLRKAVKVRQQAYARHVPEFAASLAQPEASDFADDGIVLLAESRLDGTPLGSIRIRTNLQRPLDLEHSVALPPEMQGRRLVEAARLGVDEGRTGRLVKMALIKACFMYCKQNDIDWSVAMARPGVDRQYEQLMFIDVFPGEPPIPLPYAGNLPHRLMAFEIETFEERWSEKRHPLLDFFFYTHHPDIDIGAPAQTHAMPASAPAPKPVHDPEHGAAVHYAVV